MKVAPIVTRRDVMNHVLCGATAIVQVLSDKTTKKEPFMKHIKQTVFFIAALFVATFFLASLKLPSAHASGVFESPLPPFQSPLPGEQPASTDGNGGVRAGCWQETPEGKMLVYTAQSSVGWWGATDKLNLVKQNGGVAIIPAAARQISVPGDCRDVGLPGDWKKAQRAGSGEWVLVRK
jgi:hypothetical protein